MDTLNVSKKSWHYRLATTYGLESKFNIINDETDICSYSRSVIIGIIIVLVIIGVGTVCAYPISQALLWLGFCVASLEFIDLLNIGLVAIGVLEIVGLLLYAIVYSLFTVIMKVMVKIAKKFPRKEKVETPPGFMVQAYRSFKGKYCIKVKQID